MYIKLVRDWPTLLADLYRLFRTCSSYHQPSSISNYSNLYVCTNSSKIISRHRLLDQINDCWHVDDESYTESCSLSIPNHRFQCNITDRTVCLARVRVNDDVDDCNDRSDERSFYDDQREDPWEEEISFTKTCDGFTEVSPPILIDGRNETDETECGYFPCNNTYTRCDGIWNCFDGADEINCEWPPMCPLMHHWCLSPVDGNYTCLHINRVNDGIVDCFGATDEVGFCREKCIKGICPSYRHLNNNICLPYHSVCQNTTQYFATDDILKNLCRLERVPKLAKCVFHVLGELSRTESLFCGVEGFKKLIRPHLSLIILHFIILNR